MTQHVSNMHVIPSRSMKTNNNWSLHDNKNNDYNVYSVWSDDQSVSTNTAKADKIGHEASAAYIVQLAVWMTYLIPYVSC